MTTSAGSSTGSLRASSHKPDLWLVDPGDRHEGDEKEFSQSRLSRLHPVAAVLAVASAGYALICIAFVGIGLLITHRLGFVVRADDRSVRWFASHRTSMLNHGASDATKVANTLGIVVVALIVVVVLFVLRYRWDVVFLFVALSLELATFLTVNALVDRPRPQGPRLGSLPSTSSFPSGHTAAMVVLYGGIALLINARCRVRIVSILSWVVAAAATTMVGLARLYSAMHHPSDVVAGALLGVAVLGVSLTAVRAGRRASVEHDRSKTATARELPVVS